MFEISRISKFSALCLILFTYAGVIATENSMIGNETRTNFNQRNVEILETLLKLAIKNNFKLDEENKSIPTDILKQAYTECMLELSFPCLQKKLIAFLHELDKMKNIQLIGKRVSLVRKKDETKADTIPLAKVAEHVDQAYLKDVIDSLIEKFFENHSLRLSLPEYFEDSGERGGPETFLDINFSSTESSNSVRESRRRKQGNNKHKGIKKVMMLIGLMTCMKLTMLGPLMVGLLGLKAMKALILAVISLTISKMMMLSKVNMHNLFHGHDWYSSGSSNWDRNIQETPVSTSTLPYNVEPPAAYSSIYSIRTVK